MQGNERRNTYMGLKHLVLAAVLAIMVCIAMNRSATAENMLLNRENAIVYAGDQIALEDYVNEEFKEDFTFKWKDGEPDPSVAVLTEDGIVKTKAVGEVKVLISYTKDEASVEETSAPGEDTAQDEDDAQDKDNTREEVLTISIVAPEELRMEYGSEMYLEAVEMYQGIKLSYESDKDSVIVSEAGMLTAQGFQTAKITATKEDGVSFQVAEVRIIDPVLQKPTVIRAVGTSGFRIGFEYFSITDEEKESAVWKSKDESVATVNAQGLSALKKGTTTAEVTITAKNGDQKVLELRIIVTDPKLSTSRIVMAAETTQALAVNGADAASEIIWGENLEACAYFSSAGRIYAESRGTTVLKVTVDGKELTCTVEVTDPVYSNLTVIMYKGKSKNLKLKGLAKDSKVTYASSKKKVLTISKKGKMKAKKVGHAVIKVTADGRKFNILAEIASKKGYQASKKAIAISKTKTRYSQARRMSKGYYDCSSLVSRVYRNYGIYFGSPRGWSPVAANIGKWCARNKKIVSRKGVSYKKLLPGDLIFFSSGRNGRYRNITHVEMYTGGASDVSASSSYNKVIHYGYSKSGSIVLIARPTK